MLRLSKLLQRSYGGILFEEHLELRKLALKVSQESIAPFAADLDKNDKFDYKALWPKLGDLGLLGVTCPEEFGGSELGYTDHAMCAEEISRASGSVGLAYIAHSNLCINQINLHGTVSQKTKYLPDLCSGAKVGGLAMSEVNAGSDVTSMTTRADAVDGGYLLNGTKMWITNGMYGETFVVYAKTDPKAGKKGISAFIVEKEFKGFQVGKGIDKLGMRGSGTCELIFDNVFVPKENLLGEENQGVYVLMKGLNYERILLAAGPVGLMQSAIDVTLDYVAHRKQFNKAIGEFQMIQAKIAEMYTRLSASRSFLYMITKQADHGNSSNKDCAAVVLFTSEAATQVALDAIQCLGGNGYTNDYPVGRILRDAKLYEIGGGTNEIRKSIIAKALYQEHH